MTHQDATRITELQTELAEQQVKIEAMEKKLDNHSKSLSVLIKWVKGCSKAFGAKVGD